MKRLLLGLSALLVTREALALSATNARILPPPVIVYMPAAVPNPHVLPVGSYNPRERFARPVARLDGVPVYRPLFPSMAPNPVDHALIVRDYQKNHYWLSDGEIDTAFERYQFLQFHDIVALRDLRLHKENATLDDYRHYVVDELKINAMIFTICRRAITRSDAVALQQDYLARLRKKTVIEILKT